MITSSIVTYKTDTRELTTILKCACNSSIERVYIVDNSPSDELKSFANLSPKIEYIFGHGNIGYGSAHNIAIEKSIAQGAKYHIVLNPDIEFKEGTIETLAEYMDRNSNVGQVMPMITYPNGDIQHLCKLLPSPMDLIGRKFIPVRSYLEKRNYIYEMRFSNYDKEMEVPFLSGCFMFFRTEALSKVNGFDDDFFMYCEDIDLCRRVGEEGYKTMYYPTATVIHSYKKESFHNSVMLRAHIKSAVKYFSKWGWLFDKERTQINKQILSSHNIED